MTTLEFMRSCISTCSARWLVTAALLGCAAHGRTADMKVNANATQGCVVSVKAPPPRSRELPDALKVLPPEKGIYAGLYSIGTVEQDFRAFTGKAGYGPPIVFTFHDWISDEDFAKSSPKLRTFADPLEGSTTSVLAFAEEVSRQGGVPAIAWAIQCCDWGSTLWWLGLRSTNVSVSRVIQGDFDGYIRKVAVQVKGFGKPIMLTLFSEFNLQGAFAFGPKGRDGIDSADHICNEYGDRGWPDGPERVRDAFIHVIDLFRAEGVKNVTWFMYAGSNYMDPQHGDYSPWLHPKYFYPGDDYLDWVGLSTYFIDPRWKFKVNDEVTVISRALKPGYDAWGEVTKKPLYLPEFASLGKVDSDRSTILREVMQTYLPTLPRVKAVTLADFLIGEQCCQVPRLGVTHKKEIEVWREVVGTNPNYVKRLRYSRTPVREAGQ
jgi:hypothetical protein